MNRSNVIAAAASQLGLGILHSVLGALEAIDTPHHTVGWFRLFCIVFCFGFFGWFWRER